MEAITVEATKRTWGERLAAARRAAGRTQNDIAQATGLEQTTISAAERGKASFESFVTIANELRVDILGRDL